MPAHAQAQGHGPARWLDERTAAEFKAELDKGRWRRAQDARRWLENKLGRRLTLIVTYKYLGKCEARLNVPRPTHRKKDPAKVEAFRAELCEKLHGDGAEFLHTDGVSLEASRCFLEQVGRSAPEAMHLVIQDGAGFHQDEGAAELPANVRVIHLPPYSPELNPVERLWDVVKDRICNQVWKDLDELMAAINGVLTDYWTTPAKVRAPVGEGWLLDTANASYPSVLAAWMDNSCEMLRPGEVGRDGAEVAANQRPLRKAPARGWGGFLTTDFTDDTDGLQGRNAFIRAIRVIRGSFFAPSAEFCRGFNQAVPCSRKNWRWECGRHLGVRWQSEARAATPPWRPRCGRRCPCIRLKSPPKAAWRLRFPPHSKAPPVFPRASSLFSRDSISRILTATSRRHPAPRWKRACGTCLRSLSRRGCRPCRARNEVSRPLIFADIGGNAATGERMRCSGPARSLALVPFAPTPIRVRAGRNRKLLAV